jgi:hypothetical protein
VGEQAGRPAPADFCNREALLERFALRRFPAFNHNHDALRVVRLTKRRKFPRMKRVEATDEAVTEEKVAGGT